MKDREFFRELCSTVLNADKNIRFAGVVNDEGKLVVGEYRKDIDSPFIQEDSARKSEGGMNWLGGDDTDGIPETKDMDSNIGKSSFHASRMIFALNKQFENELGELNYNLAEYNKVKLLTLALSNKSNHYLCVSIDPLRDCQPVISRVISSV